MGVAPQVANSEGLTLGHNPVRLKHGEVITVPATAPEWPLKLRLLPMTFFMSYLVFTIFIFVCGPWDWPVRDGTKLWLFLLAAHLALFLGYFLAAFRKPNGYSQRWSVSGLVLVSALINLAILFPTSKYRTGNFIPDVMSGIENPGAAYEWSQSVRDAALPVVEYVRFFLGPVLYLVFPLTLFYWKRLKPTLRVVGIAAIFGTMALYIAMGTNRAIAEIVAISPWLLFAGHISGVSRLTKSSVLTICAVVFTAIIGFSVFFSLTMATRAGSSAALGTFYRTGSHADYDNFFVRDLPKAAQIGVLGITSYVTQGYYALYLSLEEPWVPTFGIGNSMFLTRQATKLTGDEELARRTYPARIEKEGWDAVHLWSSVYPWVASDLSFPGTVVFLFFVGQFFALAWLDTLYGQNPFAIAMFTKFALMLYYFPASNPTFQDGEDVASFIVLALLWGYTSRKHLRFFMVRRASSAA